MKTDEIKTKLSAACWSARVTRLDKLWACLNPCPSVSIRGYFFISLMFAVELKELLISCRDFILTSQARASDGLLRGCDRVFKSASFGIGGCQCADVGSDQVVRQLAGAFGKADRLRPITEFVMRARSENPGEIVQGAMKVRIYAQRFAILRDGVGGFALPIQSQSKVKVSFGF